MIPASLIRMFSKDSVIISRRFICVSPVTTKEVSELGSFTESQLHRHTYGQPTPITHPHLLAPGEVVPGIQKDELCKRRTTLIKKIIETAPKSNHIVIIPSANKLYMSEKIPYVFRQNTDFLYLTGCTEPDCALVMTGSNEENIMSMLFLRTRDKQAEKWDGPRTGVEGAPYLFGVDRALPFLELNTFLSSYAQTFKNFTLWYDFNNNIHPDVHLNLKTFSSRLAGKKLDSPKQLIHEQRLIKSPAEQKLMAKTCEIASRAMIKTMAATKPGITEHTLFAKMDYECRANGAEFLAYPPVVAAGNNATTIHYIANLQKTEPGDAVLMDAGCSVSGYCSDLTRTWPVSGQFSPAQKILYEIILETQEELISLCHLEHCLDYLFSEMTYLLGKKLAGAGVFKKSTKLDNSTLMQLAYYLCPHHTSHYLGMDVHDTGTVSRNIPMKPGMVITIEPGLYVPENDEFVHEDFRGLGIRIEDDLLITDSKPIVLTATCPKDIETVQKLVGSNVCT